MVDDNEKVRQYEAARILKKHQDNIRSKYDRLKEVSPKYFQSEYVKMQAEEICRYLKETSITPLNAWYSALLDMVSQGEFMSKFYLTFNEHGIIEPDYERIDTLILPGPNPEDFPKSRGKIIIG